MRFDNFPLELKRQIMSYFSPKELSTKVSPVSKEWQQLARDSLNLKNVEFSSDDDSFRTINHVLQGTRVEKIKFNYYSFNDYDDLTAFPVLNSVKEVVFEGCTFPDGEAIQIFGQRFPNASKLSIERVSGENDDEMENFYIDVEYLQQWKNLKSVQLDNLDEYCFNNVVIDVVKQDHQLEELILLWGDDINDETLKIIIDHQGRHLKKFVISSNSITKYAYQELISCQYLESLSFHFPYLLTDNELVIIIRELKHLKYFRLEFAREIFSNQFREMFKDVILHNLLELVLYICPKLNDNDFTLIVKNSPLLKRLTLIYSEKITDKGLESLPIVGSNLKILHLRSLDLVTKPCVIKISRELPNLCEIVVRNCPQISQGKQYCIIYNRFLNKNQK